MKTAQTFPQLLALVITLAFGIPILCQAAAPTGTNKSFNVFPASTTTLTQSDWGFSDSDSPSDAFSAVKITTLPNFGTLQVDGVNASAGQIVSILRGTAGATWTPQASAGSRQWSAIASSADGNRLAAVVGGGYIHVSSDSGTTWRQRGSYGNWTSITSSADGRKLAAAEYFGQIHTSTDFGETWTPCESNREWTSITCSADGSKLAAVAWGDKIYISTNSGVSWTPREPSNIWQGITSSADGTKLAAVGGSRIYTSNDSGANWTPSGPETGWRAITSSADGSKLAAVAHGGLLYTSADSGVNWTPRPALLRNWSSITSSADGSKLAAVAESFGQILISTDSGATWTSEDSNHDWVSITSSADGSKFAAVARNEPVYTSVGLAPSITYTAPAGTGSASFTFQAQDSATTDNLDPTPNTLAFDFVPPAPPAGTDKAITLSSSSTSTLSQADWGFSDSDSPPHSFSAVKLTTLPAAGSLLVGGMNASAGQIVSVLPGRPAGAVWTSQAASGIGEWLGIASSADGSKLAAVAAYGQIYTSTDSGLNWTPRDSSRYWQRITSSADGSKLAAVVVNGQIYTSTDSGVNWIPRESDRIWISITSSADGSKLAAVAVNDKIYTSTDSGVSWTPRESNRYWLSITSSADGGKLAAVASDDKIYTSTDSGESWTPRETNRRWMSIASSADGNRLATLVDGGQIYTSADAGVSWTPRESNRNWVSITSSADGGKLAAVVGQRQIYTSTDAGVSWTPRGSDRNWEAITSSADGSKLAAVVYGGHIHTSAGIDSPSITYTPPAGTGITSFTFQVQDSAATDNLDLTPNTMTFHYAALPATPPGGWPINPVTGLFDIDVPVQNTTASIINGFRLSVDLSSYASSHPSLALANRSSPSGTLPAYVDHPYSVAVGQTVMQRLSFSLASGTLPDPFAPLLSVSTIGGPLPGGLTFTSAAALPNNGGPFQIAWPSIPSRQYRIYYSHDLSAWFSCSTDVSATTNQTQWSDTGPPYTGTVPGTARFYIVTELPAP